MKTLYLVRHAQSEANIGGLSKPEHEIALTALGEQQAHSVIPYLPAQAAAIYTSEIRRTQQTAAPYCRTQNLAAQSLPCLNELSFLSIDLIRGMDGAARQVLSHAYWQRANLHERNGIGADTFAEFVERVDTFITALPQLPHHTVAFAHGIWLTMLLWRTLGFRADTPDAMRAFQQWRSALPMPNTAVWRLDMDDATGFIRLHFQGSTADA